MQINVRHLSFHLFIFILSFFFRWATVLFILGSVLYNSTGAQMHPNRAASISTLWAESFMITTFWTISILIRRFPEGKIV